MFQTTPGNVSLTEKLLLYLALSSKPSHKSAHPTTLYIHVLKPWESKDSGYDQNNNGSDRDCEYSYIPCCRVKPHYRLQEYTGTLDYYKLQWAPSTHLNTKQKCYWKHHEAPMKLMVMPRSHPYTAHHTPVPVPLHWIDKVKPWLDQDVSLGVLEQVAMHRKPCNMMAPNGIVCQKEW